MCYNGNMKTEILYEDKEIIVCHKPAGMPVQSAGVGCMDMESELKNYLGKKGCKPYLGIVHRLDQPVEGVMVFALTHQAAAGLSSQVREGGEMKKMYEAEVYGYMPEMQGVLTDYLYKDPKTNLSVVLEGADKETKGKKSVLEYHVLSEDDKTQRLAIELKTGRHHQIRVQLSSRGAYIIGDMKYGSDASKEYSKQIGIKNIALKAVSLEFIHPQLKKKMKYSL